MHLNKFIDNKNANVNIIIVKKFLLFIFVIFLPLLASLIITHEVLAQSSDTIRTAVGSVAPEEIGNDGLGSGEFELPFRCNLDYRTTTYGSPPGDDPHSAFSLDVNRGDGYADYGDPVFASADGKVVDFLDRGTVVIKHDGGYYTSYTHMQKIIANMGQEVKLGDKIGEFGDVGAPGQSHLHINHYKGGYSLSNRIQICFKRYGCDRNSVNPGRNGIVPKYYNQGCS